MSSTYLTIDRGNTAYKVALWRDSEMLRYDVYPTLAVAMESMTSMAAQPACAIYCSVGDGREADMGMLANLGIKVVEMTPSMPLPIRIGYSPVATLGTDRVAAAVGAATRWPGRWVLIVDAGTAVTYDVVDDSGTFIGGNIAPGIGMRLEALNRYTARLPRLSTPESVDTATPFGHDTVSAMIKGAVYGIAGSMDYYRRALPPDTVTVVTGGNARLIASACAEGTLEVEPTLVTQGLIHTLLYNKRLTDENK